jgi:hypothetical protein
MRILFQHIEAVLLQGGNMGDGHGNEESLGKVMGFSRTGCPGGRPVKAIHGYRLREQRAPNPAAACR